MYDSHKRLINLRNTYAAHADRNDPDAGHIGSKRLMERKILIRHLITKRNSSNEMSDFMDSCRPILKTL